VVISVDVAKATRSPARTTRWRRSTPIQIVVAYDAGGGASQVKIFYFRNEAQQ
jgi:hypothetical protein